MREENILIDSGLSNKLAWVAFLCSALVVFIHVGTPINGERTVLWWTYQFMTEGICRCAVPFFFMAAGFFLARRYGQNKWWTTAVKSRLKSLLMPFLIWNGFTIILTKSWSWGEILTGFGLNPVEYCALNQLWFLRSLMLFVLISAIVFPLIYVMKKVQILVLMVCFAIGLFSLEPFLLTGDRWIDALRITFSLEGFVFFISGALLSWYGFGRCETSSNKWIVLAGLFIVVTGRFFSVELGWGGGGLLAICGGLFMTWNLSPSCKMPNCLKSCAFPIYILHGIIFGVARAFGMRMQLDSCLEYWVRGCVCLMLCILLVNVGRKLCPKTSLFVFGGR